MLHVHSNHSLLEGVATVRQLVARAVEYGMKTLALTDTGGLYAAIPFYQTARAAGVKPIIGVELEGTILLARDREGYSELCRIITAYHCPPFAIGSGVPAPTTAYGAQPRPSVIASGASTSVIASGAKQSPEPSNKTVPDKDTGDCFAPLAMTEGHGSAPLAMTQAPGSTFLATAEISDHVFVLSSDRRLIEALHRNGHDPLVAVTHYGDRTSRYQAERMREWAQRQGLRAVAVSPVHFLDADQARIHRVLSAIRFNTTLDGLKPGETAPPESWFRSPREMERLYGDWPDTLENAEWVADQCALDLALGKPLFPHMDLPAEETPFSFLWKRAFDGVKRRYKPLTPPVIQRLQHELDVIHELGFAAYFLIVTDIVDYARAHDIPIVGRGSAANSLVAYALGITRVDPFKYNLYFERFLNLARTDCPDIDLDICWRRRDDVIDYVYRKYGADRVAMICTFNTFQARSALREVAKTFGLTDAEIGEVVRQIPHYRAHDVRALVQFLPECRSLRIDEEPLKSILEISEALDGFPRHLSIHSGGLVIAPEPLTHFTPLQRAPKGLLITQYDMHPIEDLGLIKMDLLGHRSLTVIKETVEMVRDNRGIALDVERLPDPDKLTGDLIRTGRTLGCFQIESPAMRALLQHVQADNTDLLIKTLSLVRPGPSGSGMKKHFIERHRGKEETVYLHPALEKVLGDTYGVMLYQEDILKVAHVIAGMDLAEADALRRAMTKKRAPKEMAKSMKLFLDKAAANGVGAAQAEAIWGLIANFAEYSYCKAHASTYGELAYQCTYLKAHFPAEFLAGVLSNRGGFYHPAVYVEEAQRLGIEIRPPDVNRSAFNYTVEGEAIRVGLLEIRELSQHAVQSLLEARKTGPFHGVGDLVRRAGVACADTGILIHAGACDGFGLTRPQLVWELKTIFQQAGPNTRIAAPSLFADELTRVVLPRLPNYSRKKRVDEEWTSLGLIVSTHPIEYYVPALIGCRGTAGALVLSENMAAYAGNRITMIGWLIAERRVGLKGRGAMKFLTFEDPAGVFEAVLFPRAYQQYGHLLNSHGPYFITGEVQEEHGCYSMIADSMERVGQHRRSPGLSDVTPPMHWIWPHLRDDAITQAD